MPESVGVLRVRHAKFGRASLTPPSAARFVWTEIAPETRDADIAGIKLWKLILSLAVALAADLRASEVKIEVKPLAEGVWLHMSWQTVATWGLVASNGVIVREGDHLVVVDTAWCTEPSRALLAWIDRELKLPVDRLIVTHFHADRLAGWEVFAERGAKIVVSEQTLALAKVTPTSACELYRLSPGEKRASGTLEIFYPGPAHAPDNVVVWIPSAKLLVGGCAVRSADSRGLGNLSDASIPDWSTSIARVRSAYPKAKLVLPGHGAAGGFELLDHARKLAEAAATAAEEKR